MTPQMVLAAGYLINRNKENENNEMQETLFICSKCHGKFGTKFKEKKGIFATEYVRLMTFKNGNLLCGQCNSKENSNQINRKS